MKIETDICKIEVMTLRKSYYHVVCTSFYGLEFSESSSAASDADLGVNRQQEEKRRRRIALFCVFSYLDVLTLGIVALVCKEWRRISRHPALWRRVQIKYQCVSSKVTKYPWCIFYRGWGVSLHLFDYVCGQFFSRTIYNLVFQFCYIT